MVNLTIDGRKITVKENTTIMEAAAQNWIPIPKLCYLKGINEIAACRVCVVELEGKEKLITSCQIIAAPDTEIQDQLLFLILKLDIFYYIYFPH